MAASIGSSNTDDLLKSRRVTFVVALGSRLKPSAKMMSAKTGALMDGSLFFGGSGAFGGAGWSISTVFSAVDSTDSMMMSVISLPLSPRSSGVGLAIGNVSPSGTALPSAIIDGVLSSNEGSIVIGFAETASRIA